MGLTGCHLVLVPAGVPRKPGQDRKDLLNINCGIAKNIVEACAKYCPNAMVALIVNPVNSVVPAMAELWAKKGLDPMKIVGVTTLDCVRAEKFVHEITGKPLEEKTQDAGTVVVAAKNGKGSATLSMGYAGARLGRSILAGLAGTPTIAC